MVGLWCRQVAVGRRDQLKVGDRCLEDQLLEILLALGNEVRQADSRLRNPEAGVQVRTLEVTVDRHHPRTRPGERSGQVGDHEALANPSLAAAHGNQTYGAVSLFGLQPGSGAVRRFARVRDHTPRPRRAL
jgi:hypothetical protein